MRVRVFRAPAGLQTNSGISERNRLSVRGPYVYAPSDLNKADGRRRAQRRTLLGSVSDGDTFPCFCEPSADGTSSVCRGPLVTTVSSCDECGVFNGINLPVCVQSGAQPGVPFCTTPCHG